MSRTVSCRLPKDLHEELIERCNLVGSTINDFVKAAIEFAMYESVEFDFGNTEIDDKPKTSKITPIPKAQVIISDADT